MIIFLQLDPPSFFSYLARVHRISLNLASLSVIISVLYISL